MLAPQLKQWESEGRYLKTVLFQHKVFCKDVGNPAAPPDRTLLLLHGFPESSFSFHKVVEGLAKLFERVVLFDFPGYGLSDLDDNLASLQVRLTPEELSRVGSLLPPGPLPATGITRRQ